MTWSAWITFLVTVSSVAGTPPAVSPQDPPQKPVIVQGILLLGEFYGPPNYGEEPRTDHLERQYYLQLPAPIGVQAPDVELPWSPECPMHGPYFIQLLILLSRRLDPNSHVGARVQVTGIIMEWGIGHDRTPLLLDVESLEGIESWSW